MIERAEQSVKLREMLYGNVLNKWWNRTKLLMKIFFYDEWVELSGQYKWGGKVSNSTWKIYIIHEKNGHWLMNEKSLTDGKNEINVWWKGFLE